MVLVDLAFASPNIDVISNDPAAPGIAELVRGAASFGDIITRDNVSRLHLVAAGQIGNDAECIFVSQMLWAAIGALAQSYDHLVIDAGAQSETALPPIAQVAPWAVLVGGVTTAAPALQALSGGTRGGRLRRGVGADRPAAGAGAGVGAIRSMTA